MTQRRRLLSATALMLCGAAAFSPQAAAQGYPSQPITVIVPYSPGATDQVARALAEEASKLLGQPMQIETRPGAAGTIGAGAVAKARADGYTVLFAFSSVQTVAPHQNPLPYGFKDLLPVARITAGPNVLAARIGAPFKSLEELVRYAKANPEKVNFGSAGTGGATHLAGEAFARAAGIKLNHIPFQGVTPAVAATVGGTIDIVIGLPQAIWPQVEGGKLIGIATLGDKRASTLPDLMTLREGKVDLAMPPNVGVWVPAGTPADVVRKLEAAFTAAAASESFNTLAKRTWTEIDVLGAQAFTAELERENRFYGELLKSLGMTR